MVATYVLRAINTILNWKDLPCFGHNLHLAIGNALKDDRRVECTVAVCKKLVSSFSYSYKKKNEIWRAHRLTWTLFSYWLSDALGFNSENDQPSTGTKKAIRNVLGRDRKFSHFVPTWQDLNQWMQHWALWVILLRNCLQSTMYPFLQFCQFWKSYMTMFAIFMKMTRPWQQGFLVWKHHVLLGIRNFDPQKKYSIPKYWRSWYRYRYFSTRIAHH